MRGATIVALLAAAPALAVADDTAPSPEGHYHQLGIGLRLGSGVRGIATYDDADYCGKIDTTAAHGFAPVCTARTPLFLGLEASYGIARKVELTFELDFGLERDFGATPAMDGPRPFQLAPGARFFFSESGHTKLFIQPELVIDTSGYTNTAGQSLGTDFGARGIEGLWIDVHRSYGFYIFGSETVTAARWFVFELDAGIGFQGRYP